MRDEAVEHVGGEQQRRLGSRGGGHSSPGALKLREGQGSGLVSERQSGDMDLSERSSEVAKVKQLVVQEILRFIHCQADLLVRIAPLYFSFQATFY